MKCTFHLGARRQLEVGVVRLTRKEVGGLRYQTLVCKSQSEPVLALRFLKTGMQRTLPHSIIHAKNKIVGRIMPFLRQMPKSW